LGLPGRPQQPLCFVRKCVPFRPRLLCIVSGALSVFGDLLGEPLLLGCGAFSIVSATGLALDALLLFPAHALPFILQA
jgi:hypothetical protein